MMLNGFPKIPDKPDATSQFLLGKNNLYASIFPYYICRGKSTAELDDPTGQQPSSESALDELVLQLFLEFHKFFSTLAI